MKQAILVLLTLTLLSCSEPADEPMQQVLHTPCWAAWDCPEAWYCAEFPGQNECRPSCETDDDCNPGAKCEDPIDWYDDDTVKALACERWESLGY